MKKAFSMIELIFVIVILGILASIALPRLAANKEDAEIARAKTQVDSIRAGIENKRSANLLSGTTSNVSTSKYPTDLSVGGQVLGVVLSPANPTGWSYSDGTYTLKVAKSTFTFKYYPDANSTANIKAGSFQKISCTPDNSAACQNID